MLKDDTTVVALASFLTQSPDGSNRTVVRWREGKLKTARAAGTRAESGEAQARHLAPP
ncbi:MAG: hypothetical protein M3463_21375 [Verrucomicrobiota bacterium]|nr:hypothetical protein [Verrucomicrobiota bacterium]